MNSFNTWWHVSLFVMFLEVSHFCLWFLLTGFWGQIPSEAFSDLFYGYVHSTFLSPPWEGILRLSAFSPSEKPGWTLTISHLLSLGQCCWRLKFECFLPALLTGCLQRLALATIRSAQSTSQGQVVWRWVELSAALGVPMSQLGRSTGKALPGPHGWASNGVHKAVSWILYLWCPVRALATVLPASLCPPTPCSILTVLDG